MQEEHDGPEEDRSDPDRGRDDNGLRVVFVPAFLLGDARIRSHGVAEHGIEVNCFEPSGQLGRRLDVLLPEEAH